MKFTLYRSAFNWDTATFVRVPVAGFMDKRSANKAMREAVKTETDPAAEYTVEKN